MKDKTPESRIVILDRMSKTIHGKDTFRELTYHNTSDEILSVVYAAMVEYNDQWREFEKTK